MINMSKRHFLTTSATGIAALSIFQLVALSFAVEAAHGQSQTAALPELFRSVLIWKQGALVDPGQVDGLGLNMVHTFPAPPADEYGWLGAIKPPAVIEEWLDRQWRRDLEWLHEQGILVYASAGSTAFQLALFEKLGLDPELYYARDATGNAPIMGGGEWGKDIFTSCYANPHWRKMQRDVTLALAYGGFDGIWFDYCGYYDDAVLFCQCEHCHQSWLRESPALGLPSDAILPTAATGKDYTQAVNRAHLRWRWQCWEEMWGSVRTAVKAKHPKFAFAQNFAMMLGDSRAEGLYFHTQSKLYDYVHLEEWGHSTAPYSNLTSYLQGQAAGQGKPVVLVQNDQPARNELQHKIALAEALAAGATLQNLVFPSLVQDHYDYQTRHEDLYTGASGVSNVGVLVSWWNKAVFEGPQKLDAPAWMGQLLLDEHIPFNYLIAERDLTEETLAKYKVLILPNLAVMSDAQGAALEAWLKKDGRIIATAATGTLDEHLEERDTPLLSQLAKSLDTGADGEGSLLWIRDFPERDWWLANPRDLAQSAELSLPGPPPTALQSALDGIRTILPLKVKAARTTAVLLHRQPHRMLLHLVNYNTYPSGQELTPDVDLKFEVYLPSDARVTAVSMFTPEEAAPLPLSDWTQHEQWVSLSLEELKVFATVAIEHVPIEVDAATLGLTQYASKGVKTWHTARLVEH